MLKKAAFVLALSLTALLPAHASGNVKAGLWEVTTQSAALQNMPKVSPEQIEQMRKMGVDISQLQSGAIISKLCITKEMAQRDQLPQMEQAQRGCKLGNTQHTSNGYTTDIVCAGPEMKGKGVTKVTFASNQSFSASSEFSGTVNGQAFTDRSDVSGKWVDADCGSVKPIPDPQQKK
jgi:hypothetical protein